MLNFPRVFKCYQNVRSQNRIFTKICGALWETCHINNSETSHMLIGNIAATLLIVENVMENLYSVKCYDILNMSVLTFKSMRRFLFGLI